MLHPLDLVIFELELDNGGVGMLLHICVFVHHGLACLAIISNGSDGCHVTFVAREYARMMESVLMLLSIWSLFTCQTMKTRPCAGFFVTI